MELVATVSRFSGGKSMVNRHKGEAMSTADAAMSADGVSTARRVRVGEPIHNEVVQFLYEEAWLLDHDRLSDWLGLMTTDVLYRAPVRTTVGRRQGRGFDTTMAHFHEDAVSLAARIARLDTSSSAWAEDPPSRCRRLVTNVLVDTTDNPAEYIVTSSLLLTRSRLYVPHTDLIPAEREDVLRRTDDGLRLASRTILLDEAVLATANLAIFL